MHHHFLYYAVVGRTDTDAEKATQTILEEFLSRLVAFLDMRDTSDKYITYDDIHHVRIGRVVDSLSHAIFHYHLATGIIQIDMYSNYPYEKEHIKAFFGEFWQAKKLDFLCIDKHGRNKRLGGCL